MLFWEVRLWCFEKNLHILLSLEHVYGFLKACKQLAHYGFYLGHSQRVIGVVNGGLVVGILGSFGLLVVISFPAALCFFCF